MTKLLWPRLSRRERQIMDAVLRLEEATASDIQSEIPDPPTYSAVRSALSILVNKGHLRYRKEGRKYVYTCTISEADTGAAATKQLLSTFFKGSVPRAISALLDVSREELTNDDLDRLVALIEEMRSDAQ